MSEHKPTERVNPFPTPASRICLWYYRGLTNGEPRVAIVTTVGQYGALDLTVFGRGIPTPTTVSGVRHKDDPFHQQYPSHKNESGCWDYLPEDHPKIISSQPDAVPQNEPVVPQQKPQQGLVQRSGVK